MMMTKQVVAAKPARASTVVVRASVESRRAVLSGFVAAGAALLTASPVFAAATPVDVIDDRAVMGKGFDLIYEARDLDIPQNVREGFTQARGDVDATKARVKASEARIDADLEAVIKKNYWTEAREQLRRQVGTLRFDLNTLASFKTGKADKKKALELTKEFIKKVEDLDFSLRSKDEASSLTKLVATKGALDSVLAFVL